MAASILQLCDLISCSVSTLVGICAENDLTLPHLEDELSPSSGAFRANPFASDAANIISAAALQLVAILLPPQQLVLSFAGGVRLFFSDCTEIEGASDFLCLAPTTVD